MVWPFLRDQRGVMYNFFSVSYEAVVDNLNGEINVENSIKQADQMAWNFVEKLNLPDEILLKVQLSSLGKSINRLANRTFKRLNTKYGDDLPKLCALANKYFHASVIAGNIFFINGIKSKEINDNEYTRKLCTFEGYVENEGAAYTAYNFTASLSLIEHMEKLYKQFHSSDLMNVLGLYWLTQVEDKFQITKAIDLDFLGEAFDSFELANGSYMWDEGYKLAKEEKSHEMSKAAKKRHFENYQLKEQAIEFWHENIDPKISNDKAAEILMKIVPLSFRKLSEYVGEAKRKSIPVASKA